MVHNAICIPGKRNSAPMSFDAVTWANIFLKLNKLWHGLTSVQLVNFGTTNHLRWCQSYYGANVTRPEHRFPLPFRNRSVPIVTFDRVRISTPELTFFSFFHLLSYNWFRCFPYLSKSRIFPNQIKLLTLKFVSAVSVRCTIIIFHNLPNKSR